MANARATSQRDGDPLSQMRHAAGQRLSLSGGVSPQLYTGRRNESVNVALPSS